MTFEHPDLPRPRAILFDWDNTLVSSWEIIRDAMNVTLTRFGLEPWTMDDITTRVRKSMRDSFPELFGDRWEEARDVFYERFREIHVERLTLMPGAEDLIRTAAAYSDIRLGVVSNKMGDHLRAEIAHLGWDAHFHGIVGATDAVADKPSIKPVEMALAGSGITPGPDVWFVGDADIDMECAHNAGATGILIREAAPQPGEFGNFTPHAHVEDCTGFLTLVNAYRGSIGKS